MKLCCRSSSIIACAIVAASCSSSSSSSIGTGGAGAGGSGKGGAGGFVSTGGSSGSGGRGSGGMIGAGGMGGANGLGGSVGPASGGRGGVAGMTASGGAAGTSAGGSAGNGLGAGGAAGRGGGPAMGGRGGGTAGRAGGGGAAGAGAGGTGAGGTSALMSFFVTSRGPGAGGNLSGLAGADAFCKMLANAVSSTLGAQMWHAYLSTTTINARDRIGAGPWRNAAGQIIANDLVELHDQLAANATLNSTWAVGSYAVALDESGAEVPTNPLAHDILTGSGTDGTLMAGANCNDWTSSSATDIAQIGHSNRMGLVGQPASWNNVHSVGCAEPTAGMNFQAGTVSQGGGRGSLYCFAVP